MTIRVLLSNYNYKYEFLTLYNANNNRSKDFHYKYEITDYLLNKKVVAFQQSFLNKSLIIYY